jgi:hypothetical protein
MNNIEREEKKKRIIEGFGVGNVISIIHCIGFIYAMYLALTCNQSFNFLHVLVACCCPYIYLIYYFVFANEFRANCNKK